MPEQAEPIRVHPPRWSVVSVPVAALLVLGLAWMVAGDRGGDLASLRAGSVVALLSAALSPAVFLMLRPMTFAMFTPLAMGLSLGRLLVSTAIAGVVYLLGGYDTMWFWAPFAGAAGAMMVAEKAIAIAAAWPAVELESSRTRTGAINSMQEASA